MGTSKSWELVSNRPASSYGVFRVVPVPLNATENGYKSPLYGPLGLLKELAYNDALCYGSMASTSGTEKPVIGDDDMEADNKTECNTTSKSHPKSKRNRSPHPVEELFGDLLVNAEGKTINPKCFVKDDGVIGVYFAANWCPPCRVITPMVVDMYTEVKNAGKQLEIVFISFDHTQESFKEYLSKMPWWAVDYENVEKKEDIAFKYGVRGIPILMFLDAQTLEINSKNGRDLILSDPKGILFPWKNIPDPYHIECSPTPTPSQTDEESTHTTTSQQEAEEGSEKLEIDVRSESLSPHEDQMTSSTEETGRAGSGQSVEVSSEGQREENQSLTVTGQSQEPQ